MSNSHLNPTKLRPKTPNIRKRAWLDLVKIFVIYPAAFCASFFPFFGGFLKSYIDELLGGSCPHTLAPFGHISMQI